MGSSLEQIELYIHCYCPLGLMEMGLATFFCPARVLQAWRLHAVSSACCRGLNMISSCDMRFLLWINLFSLSINISSCIINVIPIGDQKVHCCMHFLTIYNLNPYFFSFHVFCPDLRVDPCWFLSIPCQHKEICKRLASRQMAKTWTCIRGQPVYVRCGRVLPSCHLYQEHPPLPIHSSCLMSPCCHVSPVRGVAVAAVHQEVGEHQHVPRPGAHWPRILQRPLSLVHVVSPGAARGVSLNKDSGAQLQKTTGQVKIKICK